MPMNVKPIFTIRFAPTRSTALAAGLGVLSVVLSIMLNLFPTEAGHWVFRVLLQISLIGVVVPLFVLALHREAKAAGLRFDRAGIHLLISTVIALLLLLQFRLEDPQLFSKFGMASIEPAFYIAVANVYEVIFFAVFLRFYFEKAFGILPAIVLAAMFYSLHHAGFQPEFAKLFVVGLFFIAIFRIANHWLICFPFWWMGGIVDVLSQAENIADISGLDWAKGLFMLGVIVIAIFYFIVKILRRHRNTTSMSLRRNNF